jgi:hypothetical protein
MTVDEFQTRFSDEAIYLRMKRHVREGCSTGGDQGIWPVRINLQTTCIVEKCGESNVHVSSCFAFGD